MRTFFVLALALGPNVVVLRTVRKTSFGNQRFIMIANLPAGRHQLLGRKGAQILRVPMVRFPG